MYDTFVAYGLQYLLHKWRMKFYCKTYATALLCEFLQHIGRILNAYFPEDKPAEIFLTAVQYGMPHRESVRRLLYDSDFNHGSLRFRSWDNSIFSQGTFAGYDIRESAFCFAISGNRQIRCRSPPAALMAIKIYNRKESAMSKYVLKLLESYNERERKIAVLRYNLEHPAKVSRSEQIEAMNFGHGDGLDHSAGHISNKTLYIALNYEEQAERMNAESAYEIAKELFALECEQRRLTYFIGLLDKRQTEVIRLVFVDGIPTKEVAASFGLTYRTIDRIKRTAIENLAEMYAYSDQFRV